MRESAGNGRFAGTRGAVKPKDSLACGVVCPRSDLVPYADPGVFLAFWIVLNLGTVVTCIFYRWKANSSLISVTNLAEDFAT